MEVKLTTALEKIKKLENLTNSLLEAISNYPKDDATRKIFKEHDISLSVLEQSYGELEILKTKIKSELDEVKIESKYL